MFLLLLEVYVFANFALVTVVNFLNEDLNWLCRKRTFIVGGVSMC